MKRIIISLAVLWQALVPLFSQQSLNDTLLLEQIVVTGSKIAESPGNVTHKIDIISNNELTRIVLGNRNMSEAIMYTPGTLVSALSRNDANWGTYAGVGAKYSTYMVQGLPVDAFIDPMSLDMAAVDRIEVQRGPASVLYPNYLSQDFAGNQSPLAGTVNIILKEKIENDETRFSTSYGSYNTLNGQLYHQGKAKNISYFGGISYESSDYTDYGTSDSWLSMTKNPEYRKSKIYGNMVFTPEGKLNQKLSLYVHKTIHEGDAGRVYRGFNHDYTTLNSDYSVELSQRINLMARVGLRQYERSWQESVSGVIDTLKSNNGVHQRIVPADISLIVKHDKNSLFIIGSDYQVADYSTWTDPLTGYRSFGNKSMAFQTGLYAQEEYNLSHITVRTGLRYNYVKNEIYLIDAGAPGIGSKQWARLLWNAGLKYKYNSDFTLYTNVGNSFLSPGLKSIGGTINLSELGVPGYNGQLPNPDLRPESGLGIDLGTEFFLLSNVRFSIRAFHIAVTDAIIENVVSENPSQTQSVNAGSTTSTGIEAEIRQIASQYLQWFLNYTYLKTTVDGEGEVPFSPKHIGNAGVVYTTRFGLNLSTCLNYSDGIYDSSDLSSRTFFKTGFLLNANVSQNLVKSDTYNVELFCQFYNITNNQYEMPWQFRNTGFSMMTGLRAQF